MLIFRLGRQRTLASLFSGMSLKREDENRILFMLPTFAPGQASMLQDMNNLTDRLRWYAG